MSSSLGLTAVPTVRLRTLLRAVYKQQTPCPLTPAGLTALGLQDWANHLLGHMRHLDEPAVRAVLVAVLAERPVEPTETSPDRA